MLIDSEMSPAEKMKCHHEAIDIYTVLLKAAKAKGLGEEERRCQQHIDESRHLITEFKSVDERGSI